MNFLPGSWLALSILLALLRALLCAVDGAIARVPLTRAKELATTSAAGRSLITLKRERHIRLSLVSLASDFLLVTSALTAALIPDEATLARPVFALLAGLGAVALAFTLELVLRSFSQAKPERWALGWAPFVRVVLGLMAPVSAFTIGLVSRLARPFGGLRPERAEPMPSLDEIEAHLSAEAARGKVQEADPALLRSLLDFSEKSAKEIMIPRTGVVALEVSAPVAEVVRVISEEGHTRVPVYRETLDDLVGILHARDLVPLLANPHLIRLPDLIRPVFFVPWSKRIGAVLREMQRRHEQIAAVVDEYGGVMGVITLEDILAEIVGEFGAESGSVEASPIERLADGSANVRASISREEFNEAFAVELPGDDAETLAGWLNQRAGAIPELGERFLIDGLMLQVIERSSSRVRRVKVSPRKPRVVAAVS